MPDLTPIDLEPVVTAALRTIENARLSPGRYARYLGSARATKPNGAAINPYGCADAANILYTLGHFPGEPAERVEWVGALQDMQDPATGLFQEATHHTFHTTAHCTAALELFDARPRHPLTGLHFLREPGALEKFLAQLDWIKGPWAAAHQGAGLYAALKITGELTPEFEDRYFAWLWAEEDPVTGYWRRGCQMPDGPDTTAPLFHHLAGSFHYLFNHEHARRPLHFPAAMIDTSLRIRAEKLWKFAETLGFAEIDWVYCLSRPLRQSGHRHDEVKAALHDFAGEYANYLTGLVAKNEVPFDDLHNLFGVMCALAELQTALPGVYRTTRPLHLVLDRRPFI
jgi:hypothetical protein